jgi:hypothetical protein
LRHADLFSRRRRGGQHEEVPRQPVRLRAAFECLALDGGTPRRGEHRRNREDREEDERDVNRREERDRHGQAQNPPARGEDRHVHVVQHKDLIAQHRQPIQVVGTLLMGDGGHRCLKPGDVRLERNRDLVAEPTLDARAHGPQKPRGRPRHAEADGRDDEQRRAMVDDAFAKQHEPQRDEGVGQRGQLREHECGEHHARLVSVAELAQPPHRRHRRRQLVETVHRLWSGEDVIDRSFSSSTRSAAPADRTWR